MSNHGSSTEYSLIVTDGITVVVNGKRREDKVRRHNHGVPKQF